MLSEDIIFIDESKHFHTLKTRGLHRRERAHKDLLAFDQNFLDRNKLSRSAAQQKIKRQIDQFNKNFFLQLKKIQALNIAKKTADRTNQRVIKIKVDSAVGVLKDSFRKNYSQAFITGLKYWGVELDPFLRKEENRWVNSAVIHEMRFLNRLLIEIDSGRSVDSLKGRINMYGNTVKSAYHAGVVAGAHPDVIIEWRVNKLAENCGDCLNLEKYGPYTKDNLPSTPKAGATRCLSNCKCTLIIRKVEKSEVLRVRNNNLKPRTVMRKLRRV